MEKESIIIIGAGISGLVAARKLADNFNVTILESTSRFGGRCYTFKDPGFSQPIEGGAEFMHGNPTHTLALLKEAGLQYEEVKNNIIRKEDGKLKEEDQMVEGWDELIEKMRSPLADTTLKKFLDDNYNGDEHAQLRKQIESFAEGFDLADIETVSIKSLYKEWVNEETQFRIIGGYGELVNWLSVQCMDKGCTIITEARVNRIEWKNNEVIVLAENKTPIKASKCMITVPIGVLQNRMIQFEPALDNYFEAFYSIGFGAVIKIAMEFKQPFWKEDAGFIFSEEAIPTWWTQAPRKSNLLTGWVGGPKAKDLAEKMDEQIIEKAIFSLAAIFDKQPGDLRVNLKAAKVFNWLRDPSFLGGYSFGTPSSREGRDILNLPINNTIFFAGEGYHAGETPGTVEAAIDSAIRQAEKILSME